MLKLALKRGLVGLPWGIAIALGVSLVISAAAGSATLVFTTDTLNVRMGSELVAAAFQMGLCAVLGFVWGTLSVVWQIDRWGLLTQTLVFFVLGLGAQLIVEYACGWLEFSWLSLLRFMGIFSSVFAVLWICLVHRYRASIRRLNESLRRQPRR